ncbi:uncharacterized protein LOC142317298 isoform X2 [Lycorma delicatula]|uniref:uncharacterized protein LOC142317298 isoform X2 n=1 Tax=Lycorma delicatula TaxID=130591 RepID=UPI003F5145B1
MDITARKRLKIVSLSKHTNMTQREIASECGVGLGTVNAILKHFKETGSFLPKRKGRCGRKRKTTPTQDWLLVKKSILDPTLSAADLNRELAASGTELHVTTIRRRLVAAGQKVCWPANIMDVPIHGSCEDEDSLNFDIKVEIKEERNNEIECLFIPVNQMEDEADDVSHLISPEKDPLSLVDSNSSLKVAKSEIGSIKIENVDVNHEEVETIVGS